MTWCIVHIYFTLCVIYCLPHAGWGFVSLLINLTYIVPRLVSASLGASHPYSCWVS